jgi:hypothetical protein
MPEKSCISKGAPLSLRIVKDTEISQIVLDHTDSYIVPQYRLPGLIDGGSLRFTGSDLVAKIYSEATVFAECDYLVQASKAAIVIDKLTKPRSLNMVLHDHYISDISKHLLFTGQASANLQSSIELTPQAFGGQLFKADRVISCLGRHSSLFSHFILEKLPYLFSLWNTGCQWDVLIHASTDSTIVELLEYFSESYGFKIIFVPLGARVDCALCMQLPQDLLHYDSVSYGLFQSAYHPFIRKALGKIRSALQNAFYTKGSSLNRRRIFLSRLTSKNGMNCLNLRQIICSMSQAGFSVVDPLSRKMSIRERVNTFSGSKQIAGLFGSAFWNLIFGCGDDAVVCLGSSARSSTAELLNFVNDDDLVYIPGRDTKVSLHTDYWIQIEMLEQLFQISP